MHMHSSIKYQLIDRGMDTHEGIIRSRTRNIRNKVNIIGPPAAQQYLPWKNKNEMTCQLGDEFWLNMYCVRECTKYIAPIGTL